MLIPFPSLIAKYKISPKGVFHIGANNAFEAASYYSNGVERTVWIEALPDIYEEMKAVVSKYPNAIALNACISNKDFKTVEFNVSSNHGESSSMLEFGTHKIHHPDVTFIDKIKLTTIRVDTLVNLKNIDIRDYDFLNIDLQGAELLALQSMGDLLRGFKYLYIEVNSASVYENCPRFEEICEYVGEYGFEMKEVKWTGAHWGDAYFEKRKDMGSVFKRPRSNFRGVDGMVNVPNEFMTEMPFHYPPDNTQIFERFYYAGFNTPNERQYLPVQWTAYHVSHSFGNDVAAIDRLQRYIDTLDRSKKYYTIHQFDLGCMVDFKDLDILVFGMAGGRIDYCLPLLCMPHKYEFKAKPKTLFANFIGRKTHHVRDWVIDQFSDKFGCYVSEDKHDINSYCSIISNSIFTLCPRGFSSTSFRVIEALQYGSIPVIITGDLLEPHLVDANEYAIVIKENQFDRIYDTLSSIDKGEILYRQTYLHKYYEQYFTYPANKKLILEQLNK